MTKARYISVGWKPPTYAAGGLVMHDIVTADIGEDVDAPTSEDMQRIAFAAKMEWARIRREKRRKSALGCRRSGKREDQISP